MSHNSSHNVKPPHALVNKCTSPGFLTVESQALTFGSDSGPSDTLTVSFGGGHTRIPRVTLIQSGSLGEDDTHVQLYVENVTKTGCNVRASNPTHTSVHVQIISADWHRTA